ncbi:MAG TPA: hypothetical protein VIH93_07810 [Thermoanaerobaculia bacterium]|jgi:hypothetical protein
MREEDPRSGAKGKVTRRGAARQEVHWPRERVVVEPLPGVWVDEERSLSGARSPVADGGAGAAGAGGHLPDTAAFEAPSDPRWPRELRDRTAGRIAAAVLALFGGFLVLTTSCASLFLFAAGPLGLKPAITAELAQKTLVPVIQAVGDVALKLFGNLLAFVLGYYFAKRE